MTPAEKIIKSFGGVRPMAKAMDLAPTTVQRWKESGFIPARRQLAVLEAAKNNNVNLTAADFIPEAA